MKRTKQAPVISKFDDEYTKRMVYRLFDDAESTTLIATKVRILFGKREIFDKRYVAQMTKYYLHYVRKLWALNNVAKRIDSGELTLTMAGTIKELD
jgi:hypothetical protein